MLTLLANVFGGIFSFLGSVLPDTPFADIGSLLPESVDIGLGWANWVMPFGEFGVLLALWAAAILLWDGVRFFVDNLLKRSVPGMVADAAAAATSEVAG